MIAPQLDFRKKEYLYPGRITASSEPSEITTVLGSCVAVALHDSRKKIGGLAHYLLDIPKVQDESTTRYGAIAIPSLIHQLTELGADPAYLQAKVYGGAQMLGEFTVNVGVRNVQIAFDILNQLNIQVLEKDVGGNTGRRITMATDTFHVKQDLAHTKTSAQLQTVESRIAVLDPSRTQAEYFAKVLFKQGLNICGVGTDVAEGYDLIYRHQPNLLILAVQDQDSSGLKLLKELKKFGDLPPVIAYSFGEKMDSVLKVMELGGVDFVHATSRANPDEILFMKNLLVEKVKAYFDLK